MAGKKSDDVAALMDQHEKAKAKVANLQKQLGEAQEERQEAAELLRAKANEIIQATKGTRKKPSGGGDRTTLEEREEIYSKLLGRKQEMPLSEMRAAYGEQTGKSTVTVKKDLETSDLFRIKGKGREQVVVKA